jgi:hypothetical protein
MLAPPYLHQKPSLALYALPLWTEGYACCSVGLAASLLAGLGEIPNIRIMYNNFEHSISIDFDIYTYIFKVF